MTGVSQKYLIFILAGRRFAIDLAKVAEVEEPSVTWPIPLAPSCYTGAMNFHSTIVAVMDLAKFMRLSGDNSTEKVIILDTKIASLAFLVGHVVRIASVDQADVVECEDEVFAAAQISLPDGIATLLDVVSIAERAGETING